MKKLFLLLLLLLSGCGYSAIDSELTGQVKKIQHENPLICPMNYNSADISLGVMRNGVGSMSSEDVWMYIPNQEDFDKLKLANNTGALVKITYDEARFTVCVPEKMVKKVEFIK